MVYISWIKPAALPRVPSDTSSAICAVRSSALPARSTQVSLLPPPCDEFTTSDPLRSATRVNPPGTMRHLFSHQNVRPQIDVPRFHVAIDQAWRAESARVGCAM